LEARHPPALTYGPPPDEAAGVAVLVHGRGRNAEEMRALAERLATPGVHFFMPAVAGDTWYPKSFLEPVENNEPALSLSLARYSGWIDDLLQRGVAVERIVLCGFSQGACLTAEFVARRPMRYAGVVLFTGGVIGPPDHRHAPNPELEGAPIYLAASERDPFVPEWRVRETAALFAAMGGAVTTRIYPGDSHEISAVEIAESSAYFARVGTPDP
jgi:phospholipase/carboxylesterase